MPVKLFFSSLTELPAWLARRLSITASGPSPVPERETAKLTKTSAKQVFYPISHIVLI